MACRTRHPVLFNPVINSVSASRIPGTSNVLFQASVADNEAAAAPPVRLELHLRRRTRASTPVLHQRHHQPRHPAELHHRRAGHHHARGHGQRWRETTLTYPLTPNQFPDNPVVEGGLTGINSIRAGESHTCVLFNNGTLRCWGLSTYGQLGYGNTFTIGNDEQPYRRGMCALVGVGAKLAVGGNHTCALMDTGLVRCWGKNTYGQLGYNTTDAVGDGEAIASYGYVNLGGIAVKIAAGYEHTCALMDTGNVRCWGRNNFGQLGCGDTKNVGDNEQPSSTRERRGGGTGR